MVYWCPPPTPLPVLESVLHLFFSVGLCAKKVWWCNGVTMLPFFVKRAPVFLFFQYFLLNPKEMRPSTPKLYTAMRPQYPKTIQTFDNQWIRRCASDHRKEEKKSVQIPRFFCWIGQELLQKLIAEVVKTHQNCDLESPITSGRWGIRAWD